MVVEIGVQRISPGFLTELGLWCPLGIPLVLVAIISRSLAAAWSVRVLQSVLPRPTCSTWVERRLYLNSTPSPRKGLVQTSGGFGYTV